MKKFKKPLTYLHWERAKLHPDSEMFTNNSKIPLIMFALREAEFGIISEVHSSSNQAMWIAEKKSFWQQLAVTLEV